MATWGTLTWSTGNWGEQNNADAFPNGIGASFSIGIIDSTATVEFGWGRDLWGSRAWGSPNQIVNPSGIAMTAFEGTIDPAPDVSLTGIGFTAALGNEFAFTDVDVPVTGQALTTTLGNENAFTDINVIPTSFAITNSLGDETTAGEINTGWGRLTWGENAWGIAGDLELTGNAATLALGNESIAIDVAPELTGIPLTAFEGTPTELIAVEVFLSGLSFTTNLGIADAGPDAMLTGIGATGSVGSVEAYNLEGWGRYFWGQYEWGATGEWEFVPVTGISLSANLGDESITGTANVDVTGELMTAEEGIVDPSPDATVTGIGFTADLAVGTVTIADANTDVTGEAMTASLGNESITGTANLTLTGFGITAAEGIVDPSPDAEVTGIGFNASLAVGTVVAGNADVTVIGEGIAAGLGLGTLDAVTFADVTGIAMSSSLGGVTAIGEATTAITGIGLTMALGTNRTLIWNQVNTGTAPTWTEVDTAA